MESRGDAVSNLKENSAFHEDIEESSVDQQKDDQKDIIDNFDQKGDNIVCKKSTSENEYMSIKQLSQLNNGKNKKNV